MKKTIWVCPKGIDFTTAHVPVDFTDTVTDEACWPTVLPHTAVLKLYIQQLYSTPQEELERIGAFVQRNGLEVAVELGGARMAPAGTPGHLVGLMAAEREYPYLANFIHAGGRVDYIPTDHSLAENLTGRLVSYPDLDRQGLIRQQMVYYRYVMDKIPGLKVGAIESLGFFRIKGADRQYEQTDPTLPIKLDFETYLTELVSLAKEYGITLDHFHIDFGYHEMLSDGGFGRHLATEDFVHSLGLDCGFIAANAFHEKMDWPAADVAEANRSARERTLKYFEGYMLAGGHSDYLVFQRWQQYPYVTGPETEKYSCLGIFKGLVDSPYFPK